jgi:hypothetical protein
MTTAAEHRDDRGWIDAAARVVAVLLRSSRVQAGLRVILARIDPDSAPALVQALTRSDPELLLGALGAAPRAVNTGIEALHALGCELDRSPPGTLAGALPPLVAEVRAERLGRAVGRELARALSIQRRGARPVTELLSRFLSGLREQLHEQLALSPLEALSSLLLPLARGGCDRMEAALAEGTLGAEIQALAEELDEVLRDHPVMVRELLVPLTRPVRDAVARATEEGAR